MTKIIPTPLELAESIRKASKGIVSDEQIEATAQAILDAGPLEDQPQIPDCTLTIDTSANPVTVTITIGDASYPYRFNGTLSSNHLSQPVSASGTIYTPNTDYLFATGSEFIGVLEIEKATTGKTGGVTLISGAHPFLGEFLADTWNYPDNTQQSIGSGDWTQTSSS